MRLLENLHLLHQHIEYALCKKTTCHPLPSELTYNTLKQRKGDSNMHHCPDWFQAGLDRRFNKLAHKAEQQERIIPLKETASRLFENLRDLLNHSTCNQNLLMDWEEAYNHIHFAEKEWLYLEGVKDGIRLMYYLNTCSKE